MITLSLFDGISCGRVALERAGIPVTRYYASEIDRHAIQISRKNWPDIIQLGDVRTVRGMIEAGIIRHVDILIGGSPCQGFSFAGKQAAFEDPRSALFWEYLFILRELQKYNPNINFLLENVRMKKEFLNVITNVIGVKPVLINSALVSAQNRERFYWCNWPVSQPADRGIYLRDIIQTGEVDRDKSYCIDANYFKGGSLENYLNKARRQNNLSPCKVVNVHPSGEGMNGWVYDTEAKSPALTTNKGEGSKITVYEKPHGFNKGGFSEREKFAAIREATRSNYAVSKDGISYRKLTPIECERLQTLPDNYTEGVSNTQRYKTLGNGWTVEVIKHIFESMPA